MRPRCGEERRVEERKLSVEVWRGIEGLFLGCTLVLAGFPLSLPFSPTVTSSCCLHFFVTTSNKRISCAIVV